MRQLRESKGIDLAHEVHPKYGVIVIYMHNQCHVRVPNCNYTLQETLCNNIGLVFTTLSYLLSCSIGKLIFLDSPIDEKLCVELI